VELTSKLSGYYDKQNQLQPDLIDKLIKELDRFDQ
jgi:hypothetical protein